jgi:hypothetical protein
VSCFVRSACAYSVMSGSAVDLRETAGHRLLAVRTWLGILWQGTTVSLVVMECHIHTYSYKKEQRQMARVRVSDPEEKRVWYPC